MPNRLASSTSPYLRQHAGNPVDWQPWDDTALALARAEDKPILLSIGYAACHWCHVMAHECFEDEATARVMNDLFVCIKVDREERPDLDKVYQLAHQALAGRGGGWPLTVFLTPDDHLPFYAGTYFPREGKHGLPPFAYVLEQVRGFWDTRRDQVREQNRSLAQFLDERGAAASGDALDAGPIRRALMHWAHEFDAVNGGRHGAPKFPHAGELELALSLAIRKNPALPAQPHADNATATLHAMATRGLYDHLGGGFFRYAVDARWEIPHFEKMLYDNAQLLSLYAHAALAGAGDDAHRTFFGTADGIVHWLVREMRAPGGAFWSTLDADSEGEEGRYYVWQRDDVRALLDADAWAVAERRYGLDRAPNFEHHAWHLTAEETRDDIAAALALTPGEVDERLERASQVLCTQRQARVRPGLDDKILTSWNALLCAGLARASRRFRFVAPEWQSYADDALRFIHRNLWIDDRLYACHAGGRAQFSAYLDDYAFLLDALVESLQSRYDADGLAWAMQLADALLERFEDAGHGGFFFTAHDHEALIQRPKPWIDESTPSGNGVAARALLRLGHLVGETRWLDAAERTLRAASGALDTFPHACATLLLALDEYLAPRAHVVVRCEPADEGPWRDAVEGRDVLMYPIPRDAIGLPGVLAAQAAPPGGIAYLCRGLACGPPIDTAKALLDALA